ncbi:phosphoenolpyruvate carboxykinase [Marinobacter santoriniensis NKSG1]|uniref:Phosphoenolpyruvate carboxykinase (ATP) n=1 Tax=Marinobacter santoriniensis NKSG1 TaxID=1288826 RepID=M7CTF8_9GAMM|nr:phosphoenolpyruvate carboxykinase (ATP) [Marinobacter santoriniensis]EMP56881.1 phosphoenolpyruvate carboxykinase [Marinobacter santoriniensis NKSG1]
MHNSSFLNMSLGPVELIETAIRREEGFLDRNGALVVTTGNRTGRSTADRFIVQDDRSELRVDWGKVNQPFDPERFERLWERVNHYLREDEHFCSWHTVGAHPDHAVPVKVYTDTAWQSLFAHNMFIDADEEEETKDQQWTLVSCTRFVCDSKRDGTHSDAALIIDLTNRRVLVAGLHYAGEIKKAMFSVQNYLLPEKNVLPMHCSANVGKDGDTCLFFGLSGTGKTTLSADPQCHLIGDDEHGWTKGSVFNIEGGCYAKTINLSREHEPIIWDAIRFGALIENVVVDPVTRQPDYTDTTLTENGRCSYPLEHVEKRTQENRAGEPKTVIFLTCDVFGVLPPVSILSPEAAAYHFLSGYTARVGSTEMGGEKGITPTFSACFGAPFMPLRPRIYAELLMKRLAEFGSRVYLVNTGWTGGSGTPNGEGHRFPIPVTRAIVEACRNGSLDSVETEQLEVMNLTIPRQVPGVDSKYLNPAKTWRNPDNYWKEATRLARLFDDNIRHHGVPEQILWAGPRVRQQILD